MRVKIIKRDKWKQMSLKDREEELANFAFSSGGSSAVVIRCESWWSWAKRKVREVLGGE